jgi:hypothetical protein
MTDTQLSRFTWIPHLAIAQDEVQEDREHRTARGTLETPDGDPAQTDPEIMEMAGQAPAAATGGLVFELKAKGEEKSHDTFEKRFAVAQQLKTWKVFQSC